ncbi:MAG: hypothetical protein R3F24_12900 [Gammaproteobacteria bacterium]
MTGFAIDLNDAQIAVADGSGLLHSEPGYSAVDGVTTRFGSDASAIVRRDPHTSSLTHWRDFGSAPGSPASGMASRRLYGHATAAQNWFRRSLPGSGPDTAQNTKVSGLPCRRAGPALRLRLYERWRVNCISR